MPAIQPETLYAQAQATLRRNPTDAQAWWNLGNSLLQMGEGAASQKSFLAAFQLFLRPKSERRSILILNSERRFFRHEFPVFQHLQAKGHDAWFVTPHLDRFNAALEEPNVAGSRVLYAPVNDGPRWYESFDQSRFFIMISASVKPRLYLDDGVSSAFLTHDLMGFHRTDLKPWDQCSADAQVCLRSFSAFDYYLVGTQAAAEDLVHRVQTYRDPAQKKPQYVIPAGYPRLDRASRRRTDGRDIIVAPTERGVSVGTWTFEETRDLLRALVLSYPDRRIEFRPHPSDLDRYREDYTAIQNEFETNLHFDDAPSCSSWSESGVLVTDTSGTACTYALSQLKPVVYFSPREADLVAAFPHAHALKLRRRLGRVAWRIDQVVDAVCELSGSDLTDSLRRVRDDVVYQPGQSLRYLSELLEIIRRGGSRSGWSSL